MADADVSVRELRRALASETAAPDPVVSAPVVSVVVLAFGTEPLLEPCIKALLGSEGVEPDVILVDNGCIDGSVARLEAQALPGLRIVRSYENLGYAAGCNEGARHAVGSYVAFVNYDAVVQPESLYHLIEVAAQPGVGIATASIRLFDEPGLLNSAGNDIHFLGLSWSGHFRKTADLFPDRHDVTGASGAGMAMTRKTWDLLGGFNATFFMYHDDAELSLRCHLAGLRVVYVPEAVILHRYEFSRNPQKFYLIERNRLIMVLTSYQLRTLALILPALLVIEAATFVLALAEGWWKSKLRAWTWLAANSSTLRRRRNWVQAQRLLADRALSDFFVSRIQPGNYELSPVMNVLNAMLSAYWAVVRRLL